MSDWPVFEGDLTPEVLAMLLDPPRVYALKFSFENLAPGEIRGVSKTVPIGIDIFQLVVPPPPVSRWWKLWCLFSGIVMNCLFVVPRVLERLRDGHWGWFPLHRYPDDFRRILDVQVEGYSQFVCGVTASCFYPQYTVGLKFQAVRPGKELALVVMNSGKREASLEVVVVGTPCSLVSAYPKEFIESRPRGK